MDKIKVAQIGVTHEHAAAKMESLRKMTDLFEIVGVVDDMETTKHAARFLNSMKPFEGLRHLTEEELFRELIQHHVSGHMKLAPEHLHPTVLKYMRKSSAEEFFEVVRRFYEESAKCGKKQ